MSGSVEIDESAFPIVVATFRGHVTAEVLARYFARLDAWCSSGRSYAAVLDIARTSVPTAAERQHVGKEMAARDAAIARYCAGTAVVLTSALLRGAVTAVLWLHPLKHPHAIVATRADGRALCAGWIDAAPQSRWLQPRSAGEIRSPG
jgi:hypothetical protein